MKSTLLIAIALMLVGCGVKKPIYPRQDPYQYRQESMTDKDLKNMTAIERKTLARDPSGILRMQAAIRSASNKQLHIEYRVLWKDEMGMVLNPDQGWLTKLLEPNVQDYIQANSLSPRAVDYEIGLRWAEVYKP